MISQAAYLPARRVIPYNLLLLTATLTMTFLTFVKESGMYQNEWHSWRALAYLLAMKLYYPLLVVNLMVLLIFARHHLVRRKPSFILAAAAVTFVINVALFSANNVINLIDGRPLHCLHKGIGW
ncbi:MAG: hypothetical protein ABIT76_04330 [Chthoniobacterales bacterium]